MLALMAGVFVLFLVRNHQHAERLIRAESTAAARLRELATAPPGPPVVEGGYRFQWVEGDGLPPLLVARPERRGEDGCAHLAATTDGTVYAYDTVQRYTEGNRPDVTPLRVNLTRPPEEQEKTAAPGGWRRVG